MSQASTVTSSLTSSATRVVVAAHVGHGGRGAGSSVMAAAAYRYRTAGRCPGGRTGAGLPDLMRHLPVLRTCVLLLVLALSACTTAVAPVQVAGDRPPPKVTATPTPPVPDDEAPLPQAAPFTVGVTQVRVTGVNNAVLFGGAETPADAAAANQAVDLAAASLGRYLNAQLVDRATMFSDAGTATLVDPATLDEQTRSALGTLDRSRVLGTVSGSATAIADVLIDGTTVEAVTLTYTADAELVLVGARGPLTQSGTITFTPLQGQLTPVSWRPVTTFGGDLEAALS